MAEVYDFPGEYSMQFDGVAPSESCGYFVAWSYSEGTRNASLQQVRMTQGGAGSAEAEVWLMSGRARDLVIRKLNRAGVALEGWKVRNARPLKVSGRTASKNQVTIEKIEITHEKISRIP
jgi:hypothetical protein